MDWRTCIKKRIVKHTEVDRNRLSSLREMSILKIKSADNLPEDHYYSKIVLLYDALRELLECKALEHGYRILNHACYAGFLKEVLKTDDAYVFDELRKTRNRINYYGEKVANPEITILTLKRLVKKYS